jgi:uncharacterized protein YjbI with pentapeptide repeats
MKKAKFIHTNLEQVDFTETDLNGAKFIECDLLNATFDNTMLEQADFRNAYNYSIDPESNYIKKAKFSRNGIAGLLDKYQIEIE